MLNTLQAVLTAQNESTAIPLGNGQFKFTLSSAANTSAGVYNQDDQLVRTLWSGVYYEAGSHVAQWDGLLDDNNTQASFGNYGIKVLCNNVKYEWEGVTGNTSDSFYNQVWKTYDGPKGLAFTNDRGFVAGGYSERNVQILSFDLNKIQECVRINPGASTSLCAEMVTTDGRYVYWGGYSPSWDNNIPQNYYIFATDSQNNDDELQFTYGKPAFVGISYHTYNWALELTYDQGLQSTCLAVQKNGRLLFIAQAGSGFVKVLNKLTGRLYKTLSFAGLGKIAVGLNNELWVTYPHLNSSAYQIKKYIITDTIDDVTGSNLTGDIILDDTSVFVEMSSYPESIAISPDNSTLSLIDGVNSQVLSYHTGDGSVAWTLGQLGGYDLNGPQVTHDKFMFHDPDNNVGAGAITYQPDGSFWLTDWGNYRVLHFNSNLTYKEQIGWVPKSRSCNVDLNDPNKLFTDILEYQIDYNKPLGGNNGGWTLKNNWHIGTSLDTYARFVQILTLSNGHTYGTSGSLMYDLLPGGAKQVCTYPTNWTFEFDGAAYERSFQDNNKATIFRHELLGFSNDGQTSYDLVYDVELQNTLGSTDSIITVDGSFTIEAFAGASFALTNNAVTFSCNNGGYFRIKSNFGSFIEQNIPYRVTYLCDSEGFETTDANGYEVNSQRKIIGGYEIILENGNNKDEMYFGFQVNGANMGTAIISEIKYEKIYNRGTTGDAIPIWGKGTFVAQTTVFDNRYHPVWYVNNTYGASSDRSRYIFYDPNDDDASDRDFHLGSIKAGDRQKWEWLTANSTYTGYRGDWPRDGGFDDKGNGGHSENCNVYVHGSDIFWNANGEFWGSYTRRGGNEANIWSHVHSSGLFVGSFGRTTADEYLYATNYGIAGNAFKAAVTRVDDKYYIYHCDESIHGGTHRWKVSGVETIQLSTSSVNITAPVIKIQQPNDLMAGVPYRSFFYGGGESGWSAFPAAGVNQDAQYPTYSIKTSNFSYQPYDIDISFYIDNNDGLGTHYITRDLPATNSNNWIFTQDVNVYRLGSGENYLQLLDIEGKVITNINFRYDNLYFNNIIYTPSNINGDYEFYRRKLANWESLSIKNIDNIIYFKYSVYDTLPITKPFDPTADITKPAKFKLSGNGQGDGPRPIINIKKLFYKPLTNNPTAATPTPINYYQNVYQRSAISGNNYFEYGGYIPGLLVGDEYKFQFGRNVGALFYANTSQLNTYRVTFEGVTWVSGTGSLYFDTSGAQAGFNQSDIINSRVVKYINPINNDKAVYFGVNNDNTNEGTVVYFSSMGIDMIL